MLKIARKSFTSRELENGFKFVLVNGVYMKITKAVRTINDYTFTVGEKDLQLNAFDIDYVYETEDRDIKIISDTTLEIEASKIKIIENVTDFSRWFKTNHKKLKIS